MMPLSAARLRVSVRCLLAAPFVLWVFVLLHVLRLSTGFNFLVKHLGPVWVLGTMVVCPLLAIWLGWRMVRRKVSPGLGRVALISGGVMFLGFVAYPGIPMLRKKLAAKTPLNPTHPSALPVMAGLPVFPGAEGFGTRTIAGRGGKVIEVTSLADHGPGSLRAALDDEEPRTIVFRLSGNIELERPLIVTKPFFTLAGQTAPGDGVCIKNASLVIATHDVLIQHLRVRPGNEGNVEPDDNDGISIFGNHDKVKDGGYNIVLDHVSVSWSEDEALSTWFGAHDVTICWCMVSEALSQSRHHKGHHSAGLLIGDSSDHVTVHHTLMAHNGFRNPLISKGGTHDIVNNVIYDWQDLPGEVFDNDSNSFVNWIGNTFIRGPSAANPDLFEIIINSKGVPKNFVEGNRSPHRTKDDADEWGLVSYKWNQSVAPSTYRATKRFETWPVTATSAGEALKAVLAHAGATRPKRDSVDARVANDVATGKGRVIDSPDEVGGYPKLAGAEAPVDTDHDGMPDAWEAAHGLNPHDPADGRGRATKDGYTYLEEYLHSLAAVTQ